MPLHRRKGIGEAVLRSCMVQAREEGFQALSLSVAVHNRSRMMYQQAGFEKVAESGEAGSLDDGREPLGGDGPSPRSRFPRFASLAQSRRSLRPCPSPVARPPPVCGVPDPPGDRGDEGDGGQDGDGDEVLLEGLPLGAEGLAGVGEADAPGDDAEQGEEA